MEKKKRQKSLKLAVSGGIVKESNVKKLKDQDQNGLYSREPMVLTEGKDSAGTGQFPPAPEGCFKQSINVVENRFEIGMKLEVPDPKAITNTICIATVVDKAGPRLKLKLDGTGTFGRFHSGQIKCAILNHGGLFCWDLG